MYVVTPLGNSLFSLLQVLVIIIQMNTFISWGDDMIGAK